MVRDYSKWDDLPISLASLRRVRGARLQDRDDAADGPGFLGGRQRSCRRRPSRRDRKLRIPEAHAGVAAAQGDSGAVAEVAKLLVAAENPVLIADRAVRTEAGMKLLVELAETLQAPVVSREISLRSIR